MEEKPLLYSVYWNCMNFSGNYGFDSVQNVYALIYLVSGKGITWVNGKGIPLSKGQIMVSYPGIRTEYYADKEDPFCCAWVHLVGEMVPSLLSGTALTPQHPVTCPIPEAEAIYRELMQKEITPCELCPEVLSLFSVMIKNYPNKARKKEILTPLALAETYISSNLVKKDLTVSGVAEFVGVSRSGLFRLFKKEYQMSPMEFIVRERMKNACQLLKEGHTVKLTAYSCGYQDPLHFSKEFRKRMGMSPREYQRKNR